MAHPLVSFRSALTTSFTPRFTCLCFEAAGRGGSGGPGYREPGGKGAVGAGGVAGSRIG